MEHTTTLTTCTFRVTPDAELIHTVASLDLAIGVRTEKQGKWENGEDSIWKVTVNTSNPVSCVRVTNYCGRNPDCHEIVWANEQHSVYMERHRITSLAELKQQRFVLAYQESCSIEFEKQDDGTWVLDRLVTRAIDFFELSISLDLPSTLKEGRLSK
jgi:hypothetical protein